MMQSPGANPIVRPPHAMAHAVYVHPEGQLALGSALVVGAGDRCALLNDGRVLGVLPEGQHLLHPQSLPFLAGYVAGPVVVATAVFVSTTERTDQLGGPLGNVLDPQTRSSLPAAVAGTFSFRVEEVDELLVRLAGMGALATGELTKRLRVLALRGLADNFAAMVVHKGWALADVAAGKHNAEVSDAAMTMAEPFFSKHGVRLTAISVSRLMIRGAGPAPAVAAAPPPAQRVLAQYEGAWYEATLGGFQGEMAQIRWDDGTESPVPVGSIRHSVPVRLSPPDIQVGHRVMARYGDAFYEATVGALAPAHVGIRWDDGSESWVAEADVRRLT